MKATYRGPADAVELDGLTVKRGEAADLTAEQVARIRADPGAVVDVNADGETPEAREKTLAAQAKQRARPSAVTTEMPTRRAAPKRSAATKAAEKPAGKD